MNHGRPKQASVLAMDQSKEPDVEDTKGLQHRVLLLDKLLAKDTAIAVLNA